MRLLVIVIFTLFSCCTVSSQTLYYSSFGQYTSYVPISSVSWKASDGYPSGLIQNFTLSSDTNENATLNVYNASQLNNALLSEDGIGFPPGYTLFQGDTFYNYPGYGFVEGFYVYFADPSIVQTNILYFPFSGTNNTANGLLYWSQAFGQYAWLPGTLNNNHLTVPGVLYNGIYAIVSYNYTNYFNKPTLFGQEFTLDQVSYSYNFPNGFILQASVQSPINVTVYFNSSNPTNVVPPNYTSFNQFAVIETNGTVVGLSATIIFQYINFEPNYVIGYFNEANSTWIFPNTGLSFDTSYNRVNQYTTHFSTWGLYGEPSNPNAGAILSPIPLLWLLLVLVL